MKTATFTKHDLSIHLFSVKEYNRFGELGIFHEDDRVELIEGRIVDMTPIGSRHAAVVDILTNLFVAKLQGRAIVRVQNPIVLDELSEPEPDISILRKRPDFYAQSHPQPDDVILIIEVSDSTLEYDRSVKVPLYAKARIQEAWLVDLTENVVEVYHDPSPEGYGIIMKRRRDQTTSPKSFPDVVLSVSEILGL